jgi:pyridoxal phosphate-dependent aminotransferase EpsN
MGYNYRMSNIVAGIGRGQIRVLDERVKARRAVFECYRSALGDIPGIGFMPEASYGRFNRWLTVMTIDPDIVSVKTMEMINALEDENIESRPVWNRCICSPCLPDAGILPWQVTKHFRCEVCSRCMFAIRIKPY